jgi:hypothetical protein
MAWWPNALYDTCSLITIDKILQIKPDLESHFVGITALEVSFTVDQLQSSVVSRMQARTRIVELPLTEQLTKILEGVQLSIALAEVDILIYATALSNKLVVVTGDKRLAKALQQQGAKVGNVAMILKSLVSSRKLKRSECISLLVELAKGNEFLLGKPDPKWADLKGYKFP